MPESRVYNQDCLEAMRQMADKQFDLAVVDPPYGINGGNHIRASRGKAGSKMGAVTWDHAAPPAAYFLELVRVSRNQIIWGANHFIERINRNSSCWIVWDKQTASANADCELAWASFPLAVRKFTFLWEGFWQAGMQNKESRIHPTQKPVALYKWLLTNYAKPGDTILDTHLGSGSSRIAAYDLGFDFTGYELDQDYFEAQERRFADHIAQPKLFEPVNKPFEQPNIFLQKSSICD